MLNKLPKQHVNINYGLKKNIEKTETNETKIFDNTIETLIEYFQDAGLYTMWKKNREIRYNQRPFAFQVRASNNRNFQPCKNVANDTTFGAYVSSVTTVTNLGTTKLTAQKLTTTKVDLDTKAVKKQQHIKRAIK